MLRDKSNVRGGWLPSLTLIVTTATRHFMAKKHRYTGEWPPPKVLKQFPNWEMAYEEDGLEDGQDDTTIRPQAEQAVINYDTIHTAGDVTLADGRIYPAIITVVSSVPDACSFHDGKRWWAIQTFTKKWQPQGDSVDMKDKSVFPLRIRTRLPSSLLNYPPGNFE